jgi:prepilin-type N-terminal cleavage/methylation domain-containing protein
MMLRRYCRRPDARISGFTLIEVLVVLSIIMLLAGMVTMAYRRAGQKAYQTACASNLRQIGQVLAMYAADHNGRLPPYRCDGSARQECGEYLTAVLPYAGSRDIWFCPLDEYRGQDVIQTPWDIDHRYTSYQLDGSSSKIDGPGSGCIGVGGGLLGREDHKWVHLGGCNLLYRDGRVRWARAPRL